MSLIARRRPVAAALASFGVVLASLATVTVAAPAEANPAGTGLVISEAFIAGGSGGATYGADYVELYNPTAAAIPVGGMSVQYKPAAGAAATSKADLSGSVPAGGYYLVKGSGGATDGLTVDANGNFAAAAASGLLMLVNGTSLLPVAAGTTTGNAAIIDAFGYGGANAYEGTVKSPGLGTLTQSLSRTAGADTDNNNADFTAGAISLTNSNPVPLALDATNPGNKTGTVGQAINGFSMAATGGTSPYTWTDPGNTLPSGITLAGNGAISGTPDTAGVSDVTLTVTDSVLPTGATDTVSFTFTVEAAPAGATPIADIQGSGAVSPMVGDLVIAEGVVTAAYPAGGFFGFYLQTEGTGGSVDPASLTSSEGIFVRQTVAAGAVTVQPGDFVQVTGTVTEFAGQTQVEVTSAANIETVAGTPDPVLPTTTTTWPATNAQKEALEGMLYSPEGNFTVSNTFATNQFGELGLAVGNKPLIQPTEVADAQSPEEAAVAADNAARAIILDDASSTNFIATSDVVATCNPRPVPCLLNGDKTPPYISNDAPIRVGATGTFDDAVILTQGGSPSSPTYRFEPVATVIGPDNTTAPATFENTRTVAPDAQAIDPDGTADLKIASFNVLNYFTTLGDANDDNVGDGGCVAFWDRDGDGNTVDEGCDQRGAWDPQDLARQRSKIVEAINSLDADIVGLMEIENSAKLGETPDEATEALVAALNAEAGSGVWAANPSSADLPPVGEMDVITNAIIYKPGSVDRFGPARALGTLSSGSAAFNNAREPIAQAFTPDGSDDPFLVVVNHFKSKGSGSNDGTGQGNANPDRVAQAEALVDWVPTVETDLGVDATFLLGDFNAYTMEDPMQVLYTAGYTDVAPVDEYSYSFSGLSGSLDHIVADAEALAMVTGSDIWNINSGEPLPMEYSRWNYHSTDFHEPGPYRSSDHDPVVVGVDTADAAPDSVDIQILGTNDFHGRLVRESGSPTAGAAVLAGAVKELRGDYPDSTAFVAAGDLIGASTFESFIAQDVPTIDALNEAGLDVSAAGNHEFDKGVSDLVDRVMPLADWEYIAANIRNKSNNLHTLAPTWTQEFGSVKVGYVGAVTEDLPELVSPAGISTIDVTDIVTEVNAAAIDLEADGADVIVLLVHEGAPSTNCATMDDNPASDFGSIITGVNDHIDAIVSGHTHLAYDCAFEVPGWSGRDVTERPVVSAGQYGMALNKIVFTVDTASGEVQAKTQELLNLQTCTANCTPPATPTYTPNYPADPATEAIVTAAVANAATLGAEPLGNIAGPFFRGKLANGTGENRGAESTLGNLVAEVQRWNTRNPESGSAQIAFMNPGGLRADMVGSGTGAFPRVLTYKQAADVQPFANTLVNMDLTGAQIKTVLEQQWQPAGASRPFLKLGISKGFTYTSDDSKAQGSRITGMWLDGTPILPGTTYSVTVNSFLAAGGDNFFELANGTGKQDTGKVDLEGMVDYMAAFGSGTDVVQVDSKQNGVDITFAPGEPAVYDGGGHVKFDIAGWSMTNAADVKDTEVVVKLGATTLGTFPLDNTPQAALPGFDITGTASVDVIVPPGTPEGPVTLTLVGATTGTEITVPITVNASEPATRDIQILGTNDFHGRLVRESGSPTAGAAVLAGAVKELRGDYPDSTAFVAAGDLIGASTFESFIAQDVPTIDALNEAGLDVSAAGNHEFDKGVSDLVDRVMPLADWEYIAANIRNKSNNLHTLAPTWTQEFGSVKVGYVGAVTEDLPELVSPAGISTIDVTDIVTEVNAAAIDLEADGADVIVLLVHEGAPSTNCATMDDNPASDFGSIITGVNDHIDAIVSGHTHLAYDCAFEVPGWSGRDVTERPVVSAGQYGMALNKIVFTVDTASGEVQAKTQELLNLQTCTANCTPPATPTYTPNYPADPATEAIVTAAVANAATLGAEPLGNIAGPFFRGKLANGTGENRGAESTLGNLVAEVQRWNTRNPESGSAQIAFMNPGGLRADMVGSGTGAFPRVLTYKQAADVQPFANTLVNMDLTGAQIKTVLEQQWQPAGASRPFLKLGISKGFTYTSDDSKAQGSRITGMWLDGTPILPGTTYSVTVNSFLAAGGDNFFELANGTGKQDTGKVDLEGMVDYMAAFGSGTDVVQVDSKQNGVDITFAPGEPAVYDGGGHVKFDIAGWSMTNAADVKDTEVVVKLGATTLGTFPLDNTPQAALPGFDITGTASVDVIVPPGTPEGPVTLTLVGATTGTEITVPITVDDGLETPSITATAIPATVTVGGSSNIEVTVASAAAGDPAGTVTASIGGSVVATGTLSEGEVTLNVGPFNTAGVRTVTVEYSGDAGTAAGSATTTITVTDPALVPTTTTASAAPMIYGTAGSVSVNVAPAGATGNVTVRNGANLLGSAQLNGAGNAQVVIPGTSLEPGSRTLTVSYEGDATHAASSTTVTIVVSKAPSTTSATANPVRVMVNSGTSTITVVVSSTGGTPTGTVQASIGGTSVGSSSLASGANATFQVGPFTTLGVKTVQVTYSGDAHVEGSQGNATVIVDAPAKLVPRFGIAHTPNIVRAQQTRATLIVGVAAGNEAATGFIEIRVPGTVNGVVIKTVRLQGGRADVRLPRFQVRGAKRIRVTYLGNATTARKVAFHTIQVSPRKS